MEVRCFQGSGFYSFSPSFSLADLGSLREAALKRCTQAFRPGTQANRASHVLLYIAFTLYFHLGDFPASTQTLLFFGEFLLRGYRACKSVTNALSSIRTFHLIQGLPVQAFHHYQLALFKRALPLTWRHTPRQAPPLQLELLAQLCVLAEAWGDAGVVFAALLATAFFAMARLSSLVPPPGQGPFDVTRFPTLGDVRGSPGRLLLKIKWAKAHQAPEDAFWVPLLAAGWAPVCPVARLRRLLAIRQGEPSRSPLFGLGEGRSTGGRRAFFFTTRTAREWLRSALCLLGRGEEGFTFHSLRRGACTRAFQRGADLVDIQKLGGWSSTAVQLYIPHMAAKHRAASALLP